MPSDSLPKINQTGSESDQRKPMLQQLIEEEEKKAQEETKLEEFTCAICMVIMVEPCQLHCGHRFCIQCVGKIFQNKHQCALCRTQMPQGFVEKVDK